MWKVILLIEPNSSYATGLLQGVLEYSRINGPWTFYREPIAPFYRVRDWSSHIDKKEMGSKWDHYSITNCHSEYYFFAFAYHCHQ